MTSVYDWYQYFLRASDADVMRYLKVFSLKSLEEIEEIGENEIPQADPETATDSTELPEDDTNTTPDEEIDIPQDNTPLAQTGDNDVLLIAAGAAFIALCALAFSRKRR